MTREDVIARLKEILQESFDIDPNTVTADSNIVTDLDLDSIDAIDMVAQVQRELNCRLTAEDFKAVRTIGDIADVICARVAGN